MKLRPARPALAHEPPLTLNGWLRYDVVRSILAQQDGVRSVLEIGSGEGALGARLARRYDYVGLEPDRRSFRKAAERLRRIGSGRVLRGSIEQLATAGEFDLVCAFEVLEHVEDDLGTLRTWCHHVRPGGWMLVSMPAWRSRWGPSDERVGHVRRYDPADAEALLTAAGLRQPSVLVYGFPLGYILQPAWALVASRRPRRGTTAERTASSGRWFQPPERLGWLTQAASAPFRLLQRPFLRTNLGTGLVCFAQRPPDGAP